MPAAQKDAPQTSEGQPEWFQRWLAEWDKKLRHSKEEDSTKPSNEGGRKPVTRRKAA